MKQNPLRLIHISDMHLFANIQGSLLGVKTRESLQAVLEQVQQRAMDLMLLTGDLSQDGSEDAYIHLANCFKTFNVPVYYAPGNHDDVSVMSRIYPREKISQQQHFIIKRWQFILL